MMNMSQVAEMKTMGVWVFGTKVYPHLVAFSAKSAAL